MPPMSAQLIVRNTTKSFPGKAEAVRVLDEAKTVEIARKEFPTLDPAVVEAAVKRMLSDGVYPPSVDITADALKASMHTQIALGNLGAQPDYKNFVMKKFIEPTLAMK